MLGDSLYAKIRMSRPSCDKWLASGAKDADAFEEWGSLDAQRCTEAKESVMERFERVGDGEDLFCCDYDESERAFIIAGAELAADESTIVSLIAAIRGAAEYADAKESSFAMLFSAEGGGDPDALIEISASGSRFIDPTSDEPEVLYFINEAEEFIETMIEDE